MIRRYRHPISDGSTPMFEGERLIADRYRLLEKVGEGGAAEVYRAKDRRLDRTIAIKLLRPQFMSDPASRQRFAVEAKAAAGLSHPNIVDVYDFGEAPDGSMFIAMQFVEGEDLKSVLQERGKMSPGETITIALQVCRALAVAHAKGLIHRDVKPQNIMVDKQGNVRLTDFGVVKALSGPALTQSGMTFGTAAYLSPEQATGQAIGAQSDIYALGCVMYEMLSGTPPFVGDNPAVVAYKQVWEQPRPLHDVVAEVPPSLEAVVMRCLNKDPSRRYANTGELAAELERLNTGFNQPTQAMALGAAVAQAASTPGWSAASVPPAERAEPVPISREPALASPPPVHAYTGPYNDVSAPTAAMTPGTPQPQATASPYTVQAAPGAQVINVNARRKVAWLPLALLALAGLGLCGFLGLQGRQLFGGGGNPTATAVVAQALAPSPTSSAGAVVVGSPVSQIANATTAPAPPPVEPPTEAPVPPTDTAAPIPPTDTPVPPPTDTPVPPPTDTPVPAPTEAPPTPAPVEPTAPPVAPTDTPAPPPVEPTTPPAPAPQGGSTARLEDNAFVGGYTNTTGLYHGRTAHWVYGRGTKYSSMSATFNVADTPGGTAALTVVGVDSEDAAKTPMIVAINGAVIYQGPDPLPNDSLNGPNGAGNWGNWTWQFSSQLLHPGANTVTITNLDPSNKINYPIFIMIDSASITWGL